MCGRLRWESACGTAPILIWTFCAKIYEKITRQAEHLVKVGEDIEAEYGVPIINKRISVTPIAIAAEACRTDSYVAGGRGAGPGGENRRREFYRRVFRAGSQRVHQRGSGLVIRFRRRWQSTDCVCSSVNLASTSTGINMDCVARMGKIIKQTAMLTKDRDAIGCAKLVVFANAVEDNPFMAGAFHGVGEAEACINVGVSGPGVVLRAIEQVRGADFGVLAETIKKTAFKITRVGQLVAQEASRRLNVPFGIVDLSLAPTPAIGDSVAAILEEMGLESTGAPGTTAALAL
jgi:uncharacterized protein